MAWALSSESNSNSNQKTNFLEKHFEDNLAFSDTCVCIQIKSVMPIYENYKVFALSLHLNYIQIFIRYGVAGMRRNRWSVGLLTAKKQTKFARTTFDLHILVTEKT